MDKKKIISLLAAGVMMIGITVSLGTGAWFTDNKTSNSNVFKTGTLKLGDPGKITSDIAIDNIYPGWTTSKTVNISNVGSLDLKYKMNITPLAGNILYDGQTPLQVKINNGGFVDINTLGEVYLGEIPSNSTRTFNIAFKLPQVAGNDYADKTASFDFNFIAAQLNDTSFNVLSKQVAYYTGLNFRRSNKPIVESNIANSTKVAQVINADGSVGITVSSPANTYVDSGFVMNIGTLGNLQGITVQGTGDYGLNLYFDVDKNGSFFSWNSDGTFAGINGDAYALYNEIHGATINITNSSKFGLQNQGQGKYEYTLDELKAKYGSDTPVGIWVGVTRGGSEATNPISAVINSVTVNHN